MDFIARPTRLPSGTKPQPRVSSLWSRLSPMAKYWPAGTVQLPGGKGLPSGSSRMACGRPGSISLTIGVPLLSSAMPVPTKMPSGAYSIASPLTLMRSPTTSIVSPGRPMMRLM